MYVNEKGENQQEELLDFQARAFHHEYDHLIGRPFIHWKLNIGDIEIKDEYKEDFENLAITLEHYRNRLRDAKLSKPDLFEQIDIPLINREENDDLMIHYELNNKKQLSFEEIMLIDIEKGIRKDMKLKMRRDSLKDIKNNKI
jgi:hypothetical protein